MNNKICFITCVNDENIYTKCLRYINQLRVPDDFEIEIKSIRDSQGMAISYNKAMRESDAKYKVYLHQDTYIMNEDFIYDIVDIFNKDINIGMVGVAGCSKMPMSGIWWEGIKRYGKVIESHTGVLDLLKFDYVENIEEVESIDGLIMVTQYDVTWRDDLFDAWHFYDSSQCMEFKRLGYKVCIPFQSSPWCIHDCGIVNIDNYDKYRNIFLGEYLKFC